MLHFKKPGLAPEESDRQVRESVESMLDDIAQRGEAQRKRPCDVSA